MYICIGIFIVDVTLISRKIRTKKVTSFFSIFKDKKELLSHVCSDVI